MVEIISSGLVVLDFFAKTVEEIPGKGGVRLFEESAVDIGGNAVNSAVTASLLGASAGVVGRVGDDLFGRILRERLRKYSLDLSGLVIDESRPTSVSYILVAKDGEKRVLHTYGANSAFCPADIEFGRFPSAKVFLLGGYFAMPSFRGEEAGEVLKEARSIGLITAVDTTGGGELTVVGDLLPLLPHTDFIFPNLGEARTITAETEPERMARRLIEMGVKHACIKMGLEGCLISDGRRTLHIPAFEVESVDAIGAGDTFVGAFLFALSRSFPLEECGRLANAVGAMCVSHIGATSGLRSLDETRRFVEETPVRSPFNR